MNATAEDIYNEIARMYENGKNKHGVYYIESLKLYKTRGNGKWTHPERIDINGINLKMVCWYVYGKDIPDFYLDIPKRENFFSVVDGVRDWYFHTIDDGLAEAYYN